MTDKPRERMQPFYLEDALQAFADTTRDVLVDLLQIDEQEAARLGREIMVRFAEDHPGETVYFPKGMAYRLELRDQRIYAEFNGKNYSELARRYKVTPRHIRRVVRRARAIDTTQRRLFPEQDGDLPDRH